MKLTVRLEDPETILDDIDRIFSQQWEEVERVWRGADYNPDKGYFRKMMAANAMLCIVARADGAIVGILNMVCGIDVLDQEPYATEQGFYVEPAFRGTSAAYRMVSCALEALDRKHVTRVLLTDKVPVGSVDLSRFFERLGFTMFARRYVRRTS